MPTDPHNDHPDEGRPVESTVDEDATLPQAPDPATIQADADATLAAEPPTQAERDSFWGATISEDSTPEATLQEPPSDVPTTDRSVILKSRDVSTQKDAQFENPDYVVEQLLGEGGMGAVYNARQRSIDRSVALKVLKPRSALRDSAQFSFIAEAMITGELDHPNIVPIYDMGRQSDESPFYAMKRVQGVEWTELIGNYSLEQNLNVLLRVADAIAFAHSKHIIHRDLKPPNVMLGPFNEVLVMDWGLAVPTLNHPRLKAYPQRRFGGTPSYMAPEMAGRFVSLVDERSDVYLLGALLYRIQTGHAPHEGHNTETCLDAAAANDIVASDDSSELMQIALKAMATDPDDRYQSVEEFQSAVHEYQSHSESIALTERSFSALSEAKQSGDYQQFSRALFSFEDALTLWSDNARARQGLGEAQLLFARSARDRGDFELALSVLNDSGEESEELRSQLDTDVTRRNNRDRNLKRMKAALIAATLLLAAGIWYWRAAEAHRLETARQTALTLRDDAEQALAEHHFGQAATAFDRALVVVSNQPELSDLEAVLQSYLNQIEPLETEDARIHELIRLADAAAETEQAARSDPDLQNEAARQITEQSAAIRSALSQYRGELDRSDELERRALNHWIAELEPRLDRLESASRRSAALAEAAETLETFHELLDEARFRGMQFPGESVHSSIQHQSTHLLDALAFAIDQFGTEELPDPAAEQPDEDLAAAARQMAQLIESTEDDSADGTLRLLEQSQLDQFRESLFELLVLLSDSVPARFHVAQENDEDVVAAQLLWLDVADTLRSGSRALLVRKQDLLKTLNRDEELKRVEQRVGNASPPTSLDLYLLGEHERLTGSLQAAEAYFDRTVELDPNHLPARFRLAMAALQTDRPAAAIVELTSCIERRPEFAGPFVLRALAHLTLRDFDKALADADRALSIDPDLVSALMTRGMIRAEQQQFTDALAAFDQAIALNPTSVLPWINRGETRRQLGMQILQQADPARRRESQELLTNALQDFSVAIDRDPGNARAYLFRGQTWATLRQTDRALQDLQKGIALGGPQTFIVDCYREIGRVQLTTNDATAALWSFSRALEFNPADPDLLRLQGETLRRLGRDQEFVKSLSQYLDVGQPQGEVFWQRGLTQQRLGLLREAMQDFTRLLEADDSNYRGPALNRRGWFYLMHADAFAEADFSEALQINPQNPDNFTGRGFARALLGNYDEAVADAERAVELTEGIDPSSGLPLWPLYFNAATVYGQAALSTAADAGLTETQRSGRVAACAKRAIELLDQAGRAAPDGQRSRIAQAMRSERTFASFRDMDEFQVLLQRYTDR